MGKRITNFGVSDRIGGWSSILFIVGLAAIVLGVVAALSGSLEICATLAVGGILFMALGAAMSGLAVIVRKTLNDLVEDGDDKYLLYETEDKDVTQ